MLQVGPVRPSIPSRQLGRGPRVGSVHEDPWMSVQISARTGGCKGRQGLPGVKAGQATCMGWWASQVPVRTVPPQGAAKPSPSTTGAAVTGVLTGSPTAWPSTPPSTVAWLPATACLWMTSPSPRGQPVSNCRSSRPNPDSHTLHLPQPRPGREGALARAPLLPRPEPAQSRVHPPHRRRWCPPHFPRACSAQ